MTEIGNPLTLTKKDMFIYRLRGDAPLVRFVDTSEMTEFFEYIEKYAITGTIDVILDPIPSGWVVAKPNSGELAATQLFNQAILSCHGDHIEDIRLVWSDNQDGLHPVQVCRICLRFTINNITEEENMT